jgi:hypothetical protein
VGALDYKKESPMLAKFAQLVALSEAKSFV